MTKGKGDWGIGEFGELGGTSLPPLTENHPAQKPKVVFESFPYYVDSIIEQ